MNIGCERIDDFLLNGDALSLAAAEQHAAACDECRAKLDSWNEISDVARSMRAEWQNDMLWPRIQRELRNERSRSRAQLWQIAAAVAFFVALGAIGWYAHVRTEQKEFDRVILREAAVDQVERAEKQHVDAINQLEKVAEPKMQADDSPLMVSYREKLMLLDDAIAECRKNIDRNRNNAHLRKQLLAMYSEKQHTLQDVVREDTHESR
jgi:hypothetical protein